MFKKYLSKVKLFIKRTALYRNMHFCYEWFLSLLTNHKGLPAFFAHGGLHLIVLAILATIAFFMGRHLYKSNLTSFNQIVYTFYGDTLKNYKINHLVLEKDMIRRPDDTYNEDDIKLTLGYTRDTTSGNSLRIVPWKKGATDSCDLVSKIRYVLKNNVEDTLANIGPAKYKYLEFANQWDRTDKKSNHDRIYLTSASINNGKHVFYRKTNAKDHVIEWGSFNPVFNFWIGIVMDDDIELDEKSAIKIKFNDISRYNSEEGIDYPLVLDKITPSPTEQTLNEITYEGEELKAVIQQRGILISGIDSLKREQSDRENLYTTVYLGTIIAFMLDIIVQLIIKWKRLTFNKKE